MSFDLFFWYAPRPPKRREARRIYTAFCEDESDEGLEESSRLQSFSEELLEKYPPLEDLDEESLESSPWTVTPTVTPKAVSVCMAWSAAKQIVPRLFKLASKHGVLCYDPQEDKVVLPTGMKPPPEPEGPSVKDAFASVCDRLAALLESHGFELGCDFTPHLDRQREDRTETIGLNYVRLESSAEFRMALSLISKPLQQWREKQKKEDSRLPLGLGPSIASVDFRKLAPGHSLFDGDLEDPGVCEAVPAKALELVVSHGFPYISRFDDVDRFAAALAQEDMPGVRYEDAVEYLLFRNRRDLAQDLVQAIVKRRSECEAVHAEAVQIVRRGGPLSTSTPREARTLILAAALYEL